jgi:predicted cupin superfamily sugar epimerase
MPTAQNIKDWLKLQPNDAEGGFFAGTYTSAINLPNSVLPGFPPVEGGRFLCSAIYYFLETGSVSVMHKVTGDMIYHFYSGNPVEMLLLYPDKSYEICTFSNHMAPGANPMKVIPGGTWLGSRMVSQTGYALMGVTMAPGFNPTDYQIGKHDFGNDYKIYPQISRNISL